MIKREWEGGSGDKCLKEICYKSEGRNKEYVEKEVQSRGGSLQDRINDSMCVRHWKLFTAEEKSADAGEGLAWQYCWSDPLK